MANIPSSPIYIKEEAVQTRRPVSESLMSIIGGTLNYCLDLAPIFAAKTLKSVEFTASGTWTVPEDVSFVIIEAVGGGGGGGGGQGGGTAGAGGAGCQKSIYPLIVTPEAVIPIVIGTGGAPGSVLTNGSPGTNTTFDGVTVARGAYGGAHNGAPGAGSSAFNAGGALTSQGEDSETFAGGSGGLAGSGGGGGASSYGDGGNAGSITGSQAQDGQGYGAGGGGAPAHVSFQTGGSGAGGYMRIIYISGF